MNYLIEFATNEPSGFLFFLFVLSCLCCAVYLLVKLNTSIKPHFDGEVKPTEPWPRK